MRMAAQSLFVVFCLAGLPSLTLGTETPEGPVEVRIPLAAANIIEKRLEVASLPPLQGLSLEKFELSWGDLDTDPAESLTLKWSLVVKETDQQDRFLRLRIQFFESDDNAVFSKFLLVSQGGGAMPDWPLREAYLRAQNVDTIGGELELPRYVLGNPLKKDGKRYVKLFVFADAAVERLGTQSLLIPRIITRMQDTLGLVEIENDRLKADIESLERRLRATGNKGTGETAGDLTLNVFQQPRQETERQTLAGARGVLDRFRREQGKGLPLKFLVATLPDPLDTPFAREFDLLMASIRRAADACGYALDRHYLPWGDTFESRVSWDREPGIMIFRGDPESAAGEKSSCGATEPAGLVVFIVGETPTSGIQIRALNAAFEIIDAYETGAKPANEAKDKPVEVREITDANAERESKATVGVLGPTFSGSRSSLMASLPQWCKRLDPASECQEYKWDSGDSRRRCEFLSGTATSPDNKVLFEDYCYSSMATDDDVSVGKLWSFLRDRLGVEQENTALLVESSTYGNFFRKNYSGWVAPFPMHIAQLRSEHAKSKKGGAESKGDRGDSEHFLALGQGISGRRAFRPLAPGLTSPTQEIVLGKILRALVEKRVQAAGIIATDTRDKLFLMEQINRYAPNVRLFTLESDMLLAHASFSKVSRGLIVVSSRDLYREEAAREGRSGLEEYFASDWAHGVYLATRNLLERLNDSRSSQSMLGGESAMSIEQPVTISVVGRGNLWPLAHASSNEKGPTVNRATQGEPTAALPSPRPWNLAIVFMAVGLWAAFGACVMQSRDKESLLHSVSIRQLVWPAAGCSFRPLRPAVGDSERLREATSAVTRERHFLVALLPLALAFPCLLTVAPYVAAESASSGVALGFSVVTVLLLCVFSLALVLGFCRRFLLYCKFSGSGYKAAWPTAVFGLQLSLLVVLVLLLIALVVLLAAAHASTLGGGKFAQDAPATGIDAGVVKIFLAMWFLSGLWLGVRGGRGMGGFWSYLIIIVDLLMLVGYEAFPALDGITHWSGQPELWFQRSLAVGGGVSPLVPAILLLSLLVVWVVFSLWRNLQLEGLGMVELGSSEGQQPVRAVSEAIYAALEPSTLLRPSRVLLIILFIVAPFVYLITYFDAPEPRVLWSLEGRGYDYFIAVLLAMSSFLVLTCAFRLHQGWSRFKELAADQVRWREFIGGDKTQWEVAADDARELLKLPEMSSLRGRRKVAKSALSAVQAVGSPCVQQITVALSSFGEKGSDCRTLLVNELMVSWMLVADLVEEEATNGNSLFSFGVSETKIARPLRSFFATELAAYANRAAGQLRFLLAFITVGGFGLLACVTSYPFEPERVLLLFATTVVAAAAIRSLTVLVQMEKNSLLSWIAGTKEGKLTWDRAFITKILVFAGIPLLSLLTTSFPTLRALLLDWIQPILKMLA